MKYVYYITALVLCSFLGIIHAYSQTLSEQIISQYEKLKKTEYCERLIDAYKNDELALLERSIQEHIALDIEDSISFKNKCLLRCDKKNIRFTNMVNQPKPYFVLKLSLLNNQFIVDTSALNFDLYWFGKEYGSKGQSIVVDLIPKTIAVCNDKCFYVAFSNMMTKRAVRAMRKILKKNPDYIMSCYDIWVLPYMIDNEIYVYDLVSMKEYKMDYYMQNVYKD